MDWTPDADALRGRVAVVAGATRGAGRGIAAALGEAGATVGCTGRTTRSRRAADKPPQTIQETPPLIDDPRGTGGGTPPDPPRHEQGEALAPRLRRDYR